jgi:hypothetical protein
VALLPAVDVGGVGEPLLAAGLGIEGVEVDDLVVLLVGLDDDALGGRAPGGAPPAALGEVARGDDAALGEIDALLLGEVEGGHHELIGLALAAVEHLAGAQVDDGRGVRVAVQVEVEIDGAIFEVDDVLVGGARGQRGGDEGREQQRPADEAGRRDHGGRIVAQIN